uniref:Putative secreted protein n=1 Tax=Anopheles marajoara TaxID=58244 RepID=A0A2M4CDR0_9DIPT
MIFGELHFFSLLSQLFLLFVRVLAESGSPPTTAFQPRFPCKYVRQTGFVQQKKSAEREEKPNTRTHTQLLIF